MAWAALAAAVVSAAASSYASARTNANNRAIANQQNDLNYQQYYRNRRLQDQQQELATAATTDAQGNRSEYIPGVGWVTRLSPIGRAIQGAQDNEQRLRLAVDAPRDRLRRALNFSRQLREGAQADSTMAQMGQGTRSLESIQAALANAGAARATSGADDLRRRITLNGLRTGTGGQEAIARLGRNAMADTRTALADARLNAPTAFFNQRDARMGGLANIYNMLASRATDPGDSLRINNMNIGESLGQAGRAAMASNALGNASNARAPTLANYEDTTAQNIGGAGAYIQSLLNNKSVRALLAGRDQDTDDYDVERGINSGRSRW